MHEVKSYLIEEELELYKAMLEAQPQSMFLIDKDKNFIGVFNASSQSLAGYTVADIVGRNILEYADDPESPFYQACSMLNTTFDSVFKTGTPLKFQYTILDTYLEATITKISGDRILSQVRDISDTVLKLKDVEQKKRNELSVALIAGGLTSWTYDVETNIVSSSHDNNVISNDMPMDQLLELTNSEHRHYITEMFDDIIERRCQHAHITVMVQNREGKLQWSDVHAVPHEYSPDGKVTCIIGSQRDATKEYEHNEKLKQLNKQNALILNNTNSGFAYLTPDLIVEWENTSGIFSDTEIRQSFQKGKLLEVSPKKQENNCINAIIQAIETKAQVIRKFKVSSGIIVELIAQPVFSEKEELEGIVVRLDDITEKEESVYELAKAKEKAEQSDKLKSAFLANMSHEIRTPLNSIVGFTQLLPEVESKEDQISYINIIDANSQILLNLINDILDLSKIEAGYFTCNDIIFDLSKLFFDLNITFEKKVREGVELICDIPEDKFLVNLDNIRVSQIISNFITNAIKFTHKGYIKIGFIPMQNYVKLYVEDTGCGMSNRQAEHVFDRFEKFDSFEQGTGLGTSIAKAIVDAYDGKIGVESTSGVGSTFWAILPINVETNRHLQFEKENQQESIEIAIESEMDFSAIHILVAEDNDSNYKLIEILLKDYSLSRAANGLEALKLAQEKEFQIILMDIRMPLMDGVETIQHIRKFNTSTPIIALTANAFDDDKRRAYEVGANDFLTKPLDKKSLFETIRKYCLNNSL